MIHPPLVISQSGVVVGTTQVFIGHAARLAGILHVIVVGIRKRRDCICARQRWTNVAEARLAIGISRCRTTGSRLSQLTWKRTTTLATRVPDASCTVAVTQCSESTGFVAAGGFKVSVAGTPFGVPLNFVTKASSTPLKVVSKASGSRRKVGRSSGARYVNTAEDVQGNAESLVVGNVCILVVTTAAEESGVHEWRRAGRVELRHKGISKIAVIRGVEGVNSRRKVWRRS